MMGQKSASNIVLIEAFERRPTTEQYCCAREVVPIASSPVTKNWDEADISPYRMM
jgi:hypothetical protein